MLPPRINTTTNNSGSRLNPSHGVARTRTHNRSISNKRRTITPLTHRLLHPRVGRISMKLEISRRPTVRPSNGEEDAVERCTGGETPLRRTRAPSCRSSRDRTHRHPISSSSTVLTTTTTTSARCPILTTSSGVQPRPNPTLLKRHECQARRTVGRRLGHPNPLGRIRVGRTTIKPPATNEEEGL